MDKIISAGALIGWPNLIFEAERRWQRRIDKDERALIAVGHSMLVIYYHMLKAGTSYADLGGNFF
jgi:hypothetical protein